MDGKHYHTPEMKDIWIMMLLILVMGVTTACDLIQSSAVQPPTPAENDPATLWSAESPDGQFRINIVAYECAPHANGEGMTLEQIELIRTDGSFVGLLDETLFNCGELDTAGFEGLFWSPNSRYFYYSTKGISDDLFCYPYDLDLFRVDVSDGSSSVSNRGPVSPDGTRLVRLGETELTTMDLNTGEEVQSSLVDGTGYVKNAAWSLDGDQIAYLFTPSECVPYETAVLVLYKMERGEPTLLETIEENMFIHITWETPEDITLWDMQGRGWAYELETKNLTLVQEN